MDSLRLHGSAASAYAEMKKKYFPTGTSLAALDGERARLLMVYKSIVDGVGLTLGGSRIEIVLHDTRDPLHSVFAIQNPVMDGRKIDSPTTSFGVKLIKRYATRGWRENRVGYRLNPAPGLTLKSTTIPIEDPRHGLVAFICLNIDNTGLEGDLERQRELIDALVATPLGDSVDEVFPEPSNEGAKSPSS